MRSSFLSFSVFAFSKLNLFALVSVELYSKLGVKLSTAKKCDCLLAAASAADKDIRGGDSEIFICCHKHADFGERMCAEFQGVC